MCTKSTHTITSRETLSLQEQPGGYELTPHNSVASYNLPMGQTKIIM